MIYFIGLIYDHPLLEKVKMVNCWTALAHPRRTWNRYLNHQQLQLEEPSGSSHQVKPEGIVGGGGQSGAMEMVDLMSTRYTLKDDMEQKVKMNPDYQAEYDRMFGRDPYCPTWNYKEAESIPEYGRYYVIGMGTRKDVDRHKKEMLLFQAAYCVIGYLLGETAYEARDPRKALFLLKGGLDEVSVNMTAVYRQKIVWPQWGSTQAFWEGLVRVMRMTYGKYNLHWPEDEVPHMNAGEVKRYFESVRCEDGIKLCNMIILRFGENFRVTDSSYHLHQIYS